MLSPQLRRKVHELWSLFWSSGLSNPLVAIEQITYLLFIRQLEALDRERVKAGKTSIYELTKEEKDKRKKDKSIPTNYEKCRWSYISTTPAMDVPFLRDTVFTWLRSLEDRVGPAQNGNTTLGRISGRLGDAYFILDPNKTDTLRKAISLINELFRQLDTRSVNADIMGDIFEYLLEEVKESGKNGQFRTPRHVIRFMVELLKPELKDEVKILDPACGSGGFLLNALMHWKEKYSGDDVVRLEWDGTQHDVHPAWPGGAELDFSRVFHGYDNDRTMVRIAWMNLILHDLDSPEVHQLDALSKQLKNDESRTYDYILANPPFTGMVDEGDLSENRVRFPPSGRGAAPITTKSELLFVWLILDLLKIGGRAAVIVPDGVLFGNTKAHRELRRQLLFENTLEGVVSLPANMFQPYSGVKTSILLFQKAGDPVAAGSEPRTREVWFYEITDEAFSLDQKRKALYGRDNDLWDALEKFKAWTACRTGEASSAAACSTDYHQPIYWEERWRTVDDDFLKIFPDKSGDKGHTYPLHELWPQNFKSFGHTDFRGARQYDDAVLARVKPEFEKVIHELVEQTVKHLSIEIQAYDYEGESCMIDDPITMRPTQKIREALDMMAKNCISGVPITKSNGKLLGILTKRDVRFETDLDLPISARMTKRNLVTVAVGTTLELAKEILKHTRVEKLLVVDDDRVLKGLITEKDAHISSLRTKEEKALAAAEKNVKAVISQLNRKIRDEGLMDREFDQFGQNALKMVFKELTAKVKEWAAAVAVPKGIPKKALVLEPDVNAVAEKLAPLLKEFAKLDGYNVWRRSFETKVFNGKLAPSDDGEPKREPTLLSWIVPIRQWAVLENWGENPETKEVIDKPTHKDGMIDPKYLAWLRDELKIFDDDATVKKEFLDRLETDCLEALDFNLSAGRHKPFVFNAGQHRPPAELIGELQAIHGEVQKRLGKLLGMVGGGE